jgi:RimJ/RimL family protein N-acetyltransferase
VTEPLTGDGFRLRSATPEDASFLTALAQHEAVEPFLAAVSPWRVEELDAEIERSQADPEHHGRLVLEIPDGAAWAPAGAFAYEVANRRSRIAHLFGVMLDPAFRGRGLAEAATRLLVRRLVFELDYHRVQLEVYGFNERGMRTFERAGFAREGARRKAYRRHGEWQDGVLYGLIREDLEGEPSAPASPRADQLPHRPGRELKRRPAGG